METIFESDDVCLICLSSIEEGKRLSCGHDYHAGCLRSWI